MTNGAVPGQMASAGPRTTPQRVSWRRALRRHVALLVAVKFAALALLWALFFSPAHRTAVDSRAAGLQLAVAPKERAHD